MTRRTLRLRRAAVVAVGSVLAASLSTVSAPAHAAPPANDNWDAATEVTAIPFRATVDTTEATADDPVPADMQRRAGHSVFFHFTLDNDQRLLFSTKGSNFSRFVTLYRADSTTQTPDQWTKIVTDFGYNQSPAGFVQKVTSGTDYYVMISTRAQANGGTAKLLIRRPAKFGYQLAADGVFDRADGAAVIKGQVKSSRPVTVNLRATVRQLVGNHIVQGSGHKTLRPKRDWTPWVMRVASYQPFRVGPARVPSSALRVYDAGVLIGTFHFVRTGVYLH